MIDFLTLCCLWDLPAAVFYCLLIYWIALISLLHPLPVLVLRQGKVLKSLYIFQLLWFQFRHVGSVSQCWQHDKSRMKAADGIFWQRELWFSLGCQSDTEGVQSLSILSTIISLPVNTHSAFVSLLLWVLIDNLAVVNSSLWLVVGFPKNAGTNLKSCLLEVGKTCERDWADSNRAAAPANKWAT